MYDREPLERFLYRINRTQTWAGLFSVAMTVVGLLAVMALVVLTVWGFASYNNEHTKLAAANTELANTQAKVVELTAIANSNSNSAELIKVKTELNAAQQQIVEKDQLITDLRNQLPTNTAPSSPVVPTTDCSKCESQGAGDLTKQRAYIERLEKDLRDCKAAEKRTGKNPDKSSIIQ
ncbi:MAG TPA: hypothetical protein VJV05_10500 [Pyrinomonadaceae bacterium]|nr:hypothetical protein [Pyrinomonadaceae bacterium]